MIGKNFSGIFNLGTFNITTEFTEIKVCSKVSGFTVSGIGIGPALFKGHLKNV